MGREWKCKCKDCDTQFTYSDTKYQAGLERGHSRPERCDKCRAHHSRELQSVGQPYYVVKATKPIGDPRRLTSDLGRFKRDDRPHEAVDKSAPPIDPNKFGIKDDRLVEMFHFFKQDPGLQVVVVVGPTGSGKSTYLPYRLVELPANYQDKDGNFQDTYWTVPIDTDDQLKSAQDEVKHTILAKGHQRHFTSPPSDARTTAHKVSGPGGLDPKMFWRYGQIVVTQPRIQATRNIPDFIAKAMMGCELGAGHDIGFRHSGSPNSDWSTKLAFVTDGTLITWIAKGELDKINTIMIDEAHERSLNIDIIIGMLTQLLPRYPRLKLIIASATIAADKFIDHFNKHLPQRFDSAGNLLPNCRFMEFEGKSFKVTPHFRRADETPVDYYRQSLATSSDGQRRWEGRHRSPRDMSKLVAEKSIEILKAMYDPEPDGGYIINHDGQKIDITERQGDILGFLHGEKPIDECCAEIEKLAQSELGNRVKIKALPLYTTLEQNRQDEALKERPQPHDILAKRIVQHLREVVAGKKPFGDVLAILNNAGQIHNVCAEIKKNLASEGALKPLLGPVKLVPWFTPDTAKQLFELESDPRREMKIPNSSPEIMRVVISTSRHRKALLNTFSTVIELKPEEQRVVVSTNVAETSLTIHGILHVVDSGLINQNKWDPATQTSGVSPILQSRAGCKQRWGRAGRLQAGDAWMLYTAEQFGKEEGEDEENATRVFDFYSRPEITRSPLEQVLLTAKKSGVESLDPVHFPWLDAPDSNELTRSIQSLRQKGALDPDDDLTSHGVELGGMLGVDARVGNMLIVADRFACAVEMATIIAVATAERKGLKALLEFNKDWDEQSLQEVRRRQGIVLSGCKDDLEAALRLMAFWEEIQAAGRAFSGMLQLYLNGDEITEELKKVQMGSEIYKLLKKLMSAQEELSLEPILKSLSKFASKERIQVLRKAAENSLAIRKSYSRLSGAWQAVTHEWSFKSVWSEAVVLQQQGGRNRSKELQKFLNRINDPRFASDPKKIAESINRLQKLDRNVAEAALATLTKVGARAWAKANYFVSDALAGVINSRTELLEPLETHKKGSDWRPLDLARNDRLRAIFAHCLPENGFIKSNGGHYIPANTGSTITELAVEPAADSVCASSLPDLFVCVERRAGHVVEGKPRILYASFLVALPSAWAPYLSDNMEPFHKFSPARLGKFIAEKCQPQVHFGRDLLLDSIYPKTAQCWVTIVKPLEDNRWQVIADPPHIRPRPVLLRPRRAIEGDVVEPETEVAIRVSKIKDDDFELTDRQKSIEAGVAVDDWQEAEVSAMEWESLFSNDKVDPVESESSSQLVAFADQVIQPVVKSDGVSGVMTATEELNPSQKVLGEVVEINTSENGERQVLLRFVSSGTKIDLLPKSFSVADIGREYTFSELQLEVLPLDGGTLLIARENTTNAFITFGPNDLSFSRCGLVPKKVFDALGGADGQFRAKLVQFDEESGRVRMTTHHVFDELFPDLKSFTGEQEAEVIQNVASGTFVNLTGFMLVARIPLGRIQSERVGSRHTIYASFSSITTATWPDGVPVPVGLKLEEGKLKVRGPVSRKEIDRWLDDLKHRRDARAAIYSLYERSRQLNAMEESEYQRWSASLSRKVEGRVDIVNAAGAQISLVDAVGVRTWLPREEFTWFYDEDISQLEVGDQITVTGLEINWDKNQVTLSRKKLTDNPYTKIKVGDWVNCEAIELIPGKGMVLSINRLRGRLNIDQTAWLPQEVNHQEFVAEVTKVDYENGKIYVSRWPVIQEKLRKLTINSVLKGKITKVDGNVAKVELAPGITATLWAGEVTNQQGQNAGEKALSGLSEIDLIILPKQDKDWDNRIRVSRRQAWSGMFLLSGIPGPFFGKKWENVRRIEKTCGLQAPCIVDEEKGKSLLPCLRISGDTRTVFYMLVTELQTLASNKGCSLIAMESERNRSHWLAEFTDSYQSESKPNLSEPAKKSGFMPWLRNLFS